MEPVKLLWGLALLAAAAVADVRERRVPNRLLLLGLAGRGALYAAELLTGPEEFGAVLLGDLAQAGAAVAVLALAAAASRGALGFGDVKLMGALGLFFGWLNMILISVMAFLFAAIVSIIILISRKKKMNEYIPFGPFIVVASMIPMYLSTSNLLLVLLKIFSLGTY